MCVLVSFGSSNPIHIVKVNCNVVNYICFVFGFGENGFDCIRIKCCFFKMYNTLCILRRICFRRTKRTSTTPEAPRSPKAAPRSPKAATADLSGSRVRLAVTGTRECDPVRKVVNDNTAKLSDEFSPFKEYCADRGVSFC